MYNWNRVHKKDRKKFTVEVKWRITHTRKDFFRFGTTKYLLEAKNKLEAINEVIRLVEHTPWDCIKTNNIDMNNYREYPSCRYYYDIKVEKILSITVAK